jgi:hypothetical protein
MAANSSEGGAQDVVRGQVSAPRTVLFILVALGGTLVAAVVFLEVGIRLTVPQKPSLLAIHTGSPDFPFFVNQSNLDQVLDIGEAQFRVLTDAHGYRIDEQTTANDVQPTSSVNRVLALGA